jgi:flagellar basal body-associated protein FliL
MLKYIVLIAVVILSTVAVSVAIAVPLAMQNPPAATVAEPEAGYMYTLRSNEKDAFIVTTLADNHLVRLQLILDLDKSVEPKDLKKPDRQMLVLQDSLLRTIRACRSDDLAPQKQAAFKQRITEAANQALGKRAVRAVYLTGVTVQ